jgi:stage IV sporulation protein FB
MQNGYLRLGRIGGAPIRVHWSAPLVIIGLSLLLNGLRFAPGTWLGILILIVIHEIGHAVVVRAFGHQVWSVDIRGIGGVCKWDGSATPIPRAIIAWGGVLAQAIVLAIAYPASFFLPVGLPGFVVDLLIGAFVYSNLYLMILNLLPLPGFDGVEAWKLFGNNGLPAWWRQRRARKAKKQRGVVRSLPVHRRFTPEDILEKTPTDTKRPPPHMLN